MMRKIIISALAFAALVGPMVVVAQSPIVPDCGQADKAGKIANPCDFPDLIILIAKIVEFLVLWLAIPLATISIVWAGFKMITAAGNETKFTEARSIIYNVLIGLALAISAYVVVSFILKGLGATDASKFLEQAPIR